MGVHVRLCKKRVGASTRQVTASIHKSKPHFFLHYAPEHDDCQGSQPVPPWYVDTVTLIHKSKRDSGRTKVCEKKSWGICSGTLHSSVCKECLQASVFYQKPTT